MYRATENLIKMTSQSHDKDIRVRRVSDGLLIPVDNYVYTATLSQQGSRNIDFSMDYDSFTDLGLDVITDSVLIEVGIEYIEMVPLGVVHLDTSDDNEIGMVFVDTVGPGTAVIRAEFEDPWASNVGFSPKMEFYNIVKDVDNNLEVTYSDGLADIPLVTPLIWEKDRGSALDELAVNMGAFWMESRTGGIEVIKNPYDYVDAVPSVATLSDGQDGTIVRIDQTKSREKLYNSWTVIVERTDNSNPIRATARDMNPGSPTRWGGPMGKQNTQIKTSAPSNYREALSLASRLLRSSLGYARTYRIETPNWYLFDPGDLITVIYRGEPRQQIIESISGSGRANAAGQLGTKDMIYSDFR